MRAELKRCSSIGDVEGVVFLVRALADRKQVQFEELLNRCAFEPSFNLNCRAAIAFLEYLEMVVICGEVVIPGEALHEAGFMAYEEIVNELCRRSFQVLINDENAGLVNSFTFDESTGCLVIKGRSFPLQYAAVRNFLIASKALVRAAEGVYSTGVAYEDQVASSVRQQKKRLSIEQLLKNQEEQRKRGLEAEEYVLALERKRNPSKACRIKRISDIDVAAGYDIASFESADSECFDRFIEVKCFLGDEHFYWSENEVDVAKIKKGEYYICLVDYSRMSDPDYAPLFISDPADVMFDGEDWYASTSTYRVVRI